METSGHPQRGKISDPGIARVPLPFGSKFTARRRQQAQQDDRPYRCLVGIIVGREVGSGMGGGIAVGWGGVVRLAVSATVGMLVGIIGD